MAGRARYTEDDRARVYVALAANDGNVERTARDTGYPETTVRRWKKEFQTNPPSQEATEGVIGTFLDDAERVRDLALKEMERQLLAGEVKPAQLVAIVGVLDDKITRAKGLATSTVEHRHTLPSREELRAALQGAVNSAIEMADTRQEEIVDAEIVESQPALPAAV